MKASTVLTIFFMVWLAGMGVPAYAQPIGEVDTAGTTYYDRQHNGSCGRTIAVDTMGYAHVAWTVALMESRHVYYNVWDPVTHEFIVGTGVQIDASSRAGFVTLDCTPDGYAVPIFHAVTVLNPETNAGCDSSPGSGSFECTSSGSPAIWPHGVLDVSNGLHVLAGGLQTFELWYLRGQADCANQNGIVWTDSVLFDTMATLAHEIASSRQSSRVAAGWTHQQTDSPPLDFDAMMRISEDGGNTWGPNLNITNFMAEDSVCCDTTVNPQVCPRDTFRLYMDMSLLFDENDVIHAAFTCQIYVDATCGIYEPEPIIPDRSGIWHWSEATQNFSLIADAFWQPSYEGPNPVRPAMNQTNVQRPCLAIDTTTGYLYCSYMRYDSSAVSWDLYMMADIFVSVSTDNGANWSVGTNVTRTTPAQIPAPPGQSLHERDQTLAETVFDGYLHLFYELDEDAGSFVGFLEGIETYNSMLYQRVPVDSIATTPLLPNYPLHYDSTGFNAIRERSHPAVAEEVVLHPAYPNPFNGTTTIRFDLPVASDVQIAAYDVLGRGVEDLFSGRREAGTHTIIWNPEKLASGIYFLVLETPHAVVTRKVMLLK